ncbi:MAG: transglutaminase domain-containing protein [Cellulosilyticaceae bacterium]
MKVKKIIVIISVVGLIIINPFKVKETSQSAIIVSNEEQGDQIDEIEAIEIRDKGIVEKGYRIQLEKESKASLSRDGSKARTVEDGEVINLPGEYFLMTWDEEDKMSLTRWEIVGEWQEVWEIESEQELEEIIKLALEEFKVNLKIRFTYSALTLEEINEILYEQVQYILHTYPRLTFEAYTITGRREEQPLIEMTIKYPLQEIEELKEYNKQLKKDLLEILSKQISSDMADYEIEWQIYKYLIEHIQYSAKVVEGEKQIIDTPMTHTMYGAIIEGIAVCDGYAKSLMYMLNLLGIPTELIIGEADGIPHVWNKVEVQENVYYVDVTWGDLEEKQIGGFYDYFNENTEYMSRSHIWDLRDVYSKQKENFIYLPIEQIGVEKIQNQEQWTSFQKELKVNKFEENSIIFYNDEQNEWDERELISGICLALEKSIEYTVIKKYDTIIINYKTYVK